MKLTPLDIQQQQFRVKFRGFDMMEVDNFLDLIANEFEELLRENNRLKEEDRQKAQKIQELQQSDQDIKNVLVSAQQICEEIKGNARKEGDLIIEEAKGRARKIVDSAEAQATQVEAEIAQLKRQKGEFEASLKALVEMHLRLLESNEILTPALASDVNE